MQENLKKVTIYTDGSCLGNPGKGGWGAVLIYRDLIKEVSGRSEETTNNKMELKAVIEALRVLKKPCEVDLFTDSAYVKNGITQWIHNWKAKNWKTSKREPVKNMELWQELEEETHRHKISWHWVKAHNGDKWNERADELARG